MFKVGSVLLPPETAHLQESKLRRKRKGKVRFQSLPQDQGKGQSPTKIDSVKHNQKSAPKNCPSLKEIQPSQAPKRNQPREATDSVKENQNPKQKSAPSLKNNQAPRLLRPQADNHSRKKKHIMAKKKFQMVWPKEGPKGHAPRGFIGGLRDIFSGKGPDMFVQERGNREAITPGQWGNWDSYHDYNAHLRENYGNIASRGAQRYDPYTRKYTKWGWNQDWAGVGVTGHNDFQNPYPRYTTNDMKRMWPKTSRGNHIDPTTMGKEWTHYGPKRFRPEHDYFWQHAHRIGDNVRTGLSLDAPINPWLRMGQTREREVRDYTHIHWPNTPHP